jgi:hypothetical protein
MPISPTICPLGHNLERGMSPKSGGRHGSGFRDRHTTPSTALRLMPSALAVRDAEKPASCNCSMLAFLRRMNASRPPAAFLLGADRAHQPASLPARGKRPLCTDGRGPDVMRACSRSLASSAERPHIGSPNKAEIAHCSLAACIRGSGRCRFDIDGPSHPQMRLDIAPNLHEPRSNSLRSLEMRLPTGVQAAASGCRLRAFSRRQTPGLCRGCSYRTAPAELHE